MTRIQGWEKLLTEFPERYGIAAFSWGTRDCCLLAADLVLAITGIDIAGKFRGKYTTESGAMETIAAVTGGKTVEDAVVWCAAKHGLTEWQHPLFAQRGDLALVSNGANLIAAFVWSDGKHVVSIAESGLVRLPLTAMKRAWKV